MGGFYGNITNTSKTQFQFDKIYPSRYEMDKNTLADGVYLGRHVLIEYDNEHHLDTFLRVYMKSGVAYRDASFQSKYTKSDIDAGTLVYTTNSDLTPETGLKGDDCTFYKCTSNYVSGSSAAATFEQIEKFNGPNYTDNYHIDQAKYGSGRGYDSTVWQKVYSDGSEKYVMIAELNTVVPKFAVAADAPTMNPVSPHFDTQSTDVYYKLHVQTPWGFRVAAPETIKLDGTTVINTTNGLSDGTTVWTTYDYDENNGIHEEKSEEKNAAIYFNRAGFKEYPHSSDIDLQDNYIKLSLASSGQKNYDDHNNTTVEQIAADDIQELSINLPAIGNMMSKAWDIIHGPNRDNARTDANGSLQGRLDSFKEIKENQIPVKRSTDGTLVGSKINSALNYDNWDDKPNEILNDDGVTPEFVRDDAWIETVVDTSELVGGIKNGDLINQSGNSGISIHHTFHATDNSTSTVDKNTGNITNDVKYKGAYIRSSNKTHNTDDVIDLYVPYVDAKGHVVGHNIETVTLPYGFKTISVANESGSPDGVAAAAGNVVADKTQDTLTVTPGNKWIHLTADVNTDAITVSHEVDNNTAKLANIEYGLNQDENITSLDVDNVFEVPCFTFDEAGHILNAATHTVTLPENYTKFKTVISDANNVDSVVGTAGTITPSSLDDELTFAEGNRWINIVPTDDILTISHYVRGFEETSESKTDFNTDTTETRKNTFTVQELKWDKAGHITASDIHTYMMPDSFKNVNITNTGSNVVTPESATNATLVADNLVDTVKFDTGNRWIVLTGKANEDKVVFSHGQPNTAATGTTYTAAETPAFGATFTIPEVKYDETGHIHNVSTHTVTMPKGSLEDKKVTTATANVLTKIDFDDVSGKISIEHDNAANLLLTDLKAIKSDSNWIQATDDIKGAFNKIDTRLDNEITRATNAEAALGERIDDLDYTNSSTTQFISSIAQENGQIAVTRAAAGTLVLGDGYSKAATATALASTDSLNTAFGKVEKSLEDTNKRITDLIGGEGLNVAFDTLKEVADWLESNDSNADRIIDDIAILKGSNTTEGSVAYSIAQAITTEVNNRNTAINDKINTLDVSDNAVAGKYVSAVSETDGVISVSRADLPTYTLTSGSTNGTVKFNNIDIAVNGLKSAAYREEVYFISKAKYDADLQTKDAQIIGLNTEAKRLTNEVNDLRNRLEILEQLINSQNSAE